MKHTFFAGLFILLAHHLCIAQSWKRVSEIPKTAIYCFEVHDHTVYAGAVDRVYIGTNDGAQWHASASLDSAYVMAVTEYHHKLFVGTGKPGVRVSNDEGASWQSLNNGLDINIPISSFATWNDELYASSLGNGFYKLNEASGRWSLFNPEFFTNVDGNVYRVVAIDSTLIAVAGLNGIFYEYDPAGGKWDYSYYLSTLAPGLGMYNLLFDSAKNLYAASPSRLTLFRSGDRGRSWLLDNNGMHPGDPTLAADDQYDYAAVSYLYQLPSAYAVKVYRRALHAPSGTPWTMTDSLPDFYFYALGTAGRRLYGATDDNGLYYKEMDAVTPSTDTSDKPFIYPNPAYLQVNVALHLDVQQTITVRIFDATGRLVEMPLKNYTLAAGRQIVTLDIRGLSGGAAYIIDVSTRDKHYTGRLIVR